MLSNLVKQLPIDKVNSFQQAKIHENKLITPLCRLKKQRKGTQLGCVICTQLKKLQQELSLY